MENLVKLPSLQASFDTSGSKNLVDIEIPRGMGKVDLSRTSLVVNVEAKADPLATAGFALPGITNSFLDVKNAAGNPGGNRADNRPLYSTACAIRNASMYSAQKGKIEDVREVQSLKGGLAVYLKNAEDVNSEKGHAVVDRPKVSFPAENQQELTGIGNDRSRNKSMDLVIKLSEVFDACQNPSYDTSNDSLKFHFEFHFDRFDNAQHIESNALATNGFFGIAGNFTHARNEPEGFFHYEIDVPAGSQGQNATGAAVGLTDPLVTTASYPDLRYSPFYVGQQICYFANASDDGTAGANSVDCVTATGDAFAFNTITAISYHQNTDKLALTLSNDNVLLLPNAKQIRTDNKGAAVQRSGNPAVGGVRIALDLVSAANNGVGANNQQYVRLTNRGVDINSVELAVQIDPDGESPSPFVYATYLSERDSYAPRLQLVRNYQIPPNCRNVYVFFSPNDRESNDPHLESYRIAIDNVDIVGRRVNLFSPLDTDLKTSAISNSGERLRNLEEKTFNLYASSHNNLDIGFSIDTIMFPVPLKPNQTQQLSLDIKAADGQLLSGEHIIYYECLKSY